MVTLFTNKGGYMTRKEHKEAKEYDRGPTRGKARWGKTRMLSGTNCTCGSNYTCRTCLDIALNRQRFMDAVYNKKKK